MEHDGEKVIPLHANYCAAILKTDEGKVDLAPRLASRETIKDIQEFSGATFEQHHEHKTDMESKGWKKLETEQWEEDLKKIIISTTPDQFTYEEMRAFISSLILKAKEEGRKEGNSGRRMYELGRKEGYDKGVAEWYLDEEYERGKKEERERILAMIDALPDLDILATYKIINAHQLVCAIQEQEKKEASH